jgi:hypothetical protein
MSGVFLPDLLGDERATLIARFWSHVEVQDSVAQCWEWRSACSARPDGDRSYGRFTIAGEHIYAHRFIYQFIHGPVPEDLVIRHRCDNEPCVNPKHLLVGTVADNTRDKFERGRGPDRRGERHPLARLTEGDVIEIRRLRDMGWTQHALATRFSVSRGHIYRIVTHQGWGHI